MENPISWDRPEDINYTRNEKNIISISRFNDPRKCLDKLLKVFSIVLKSEPDTKLYVVGQYDLDMKCNDEDITIRELLTNLRIPSKNIIFTGFLEDIKELLSKMNVNVVTSYHEGFGLIINETGMYKIPTVAYDDNGFEDLINENYNGFLVNRNDDDLMANKIIELLKDKEKCQKMGQNAYIKCEEYLPKRIIDKWKKILDEIIKSDNQKELNKFYKENYPLLELYDKKFIKNIISQYEIGIQKIIKDCNKPIVYNKVENVEVENLKTKINDINESTSWKVTKPGRIISAYTKTYTEKIKSLLKKNKGEKEVSNKVSILIPVYNGSNFIKEAIESAINQTYKNTEIIVINDGSTDGGKTKKIVEAFGDKVKYIEKENGGVASALNLGIREATGEYISWLSHDDIYLPNKIEKEIETLKNLENRDTIIFSNFELIDEDGITFAKTDFTKDIEKEKFCQGIYPVLKGTVNGCTILIPKICFEDVGYFKEELKTTNDYEMWIRLFTKYTSYFIEERLIKYRIHSNQDTNKNPAYVTESNELWKNIINSLTKDQIQRWGFDIFNVYMTLYIQMKNSKFDEAAKIAYEKARAIYESITPTVSIAMPCYNSSKYLSKAIESILEQTYCNFELIIVDDNSTDNTIERIKQYAEKDFRIKILSNEFEKGVSGAMNTAIKNSRGKYFTRMDSDDISILNRIEKQINYLKANEVYGVCSVNISMIDELENLYNENVYPDSKIPHEWTFLWTNPIPNAPCMYRTNIIKDNKILFSNLKTAEDYEFLSKIIQETKVYMIPESLYLYRHTKNSLFNSNLEETFNNSIKISENYLKQIVDVEIPEYYRNLTYFQQKDLKVISEDIKVVNRFLVNIANKFKEHFEWNEREYNSVIDSIPEILERYAIIKNCPQISPIVEQNAKSNICSTLKRVMKKIIEYYKKFGFKKTVKIILKKIKDKIWKRN